MRYKNESKNKTNGIVYTPKCLADYVTSEMLKYKSIESCSSEVLILDPAVGDGELLVSLIEAIKDSGKKIRAVGYETDEDVSKKVQSKLSNQFPNIEIDIRHKDFLTANEEGSIEKFDYIIANPPYIRTQIIGSQKSQDIAKKLALDGRIDIYYAFLVCAKEILKEDGISGYITSNKFMTIKAGNSVRNYMIQNYRLHQITDLGDTKIFNAAVLPCVLIFSKGKTEQPVGFTSIYEHNQEQKYKQVKSIFEAIHNKSGYYQITDGKQYICKQGYLKGAVANSLWLLSSDENEAWLKKVEKNSFMTFSDLGKVKVGIKTTADKVFIGDNWIGAEADLELLHPLITHRNAGQIISNNQTLWKVLYPHTSINGTTTACNLDDYPKTKDYLLKHYDQLSSRKYLTNAHRNWYEIWVPQNPDLWKHKKIVFRDISEKPQFWLDETGAVVNGDCYWIDINDDVSEDTIYLALAVANSPFIEKYYDLKFNTKLYSGKRRYQTQFVKEFPIPFNGSPLAKQAIELVKKIISGTNSDVPEYKNTLDEIVEKLFID